MAAFDETAVGLSRDAAGQPGSTRASACRQGRAPRSAPATLMMLVRIVDRAAMCPDCAEDCVAVDELLRAISDVAEARTAEDVLAVLGRRGAGVIG